MAGSIVVTAADIGGGVTKYSVVWTSDVTGNVNGNAFNVRRGMLRQFKFIPGTGGAQPTNNYAAQVQDADLVDLLLANGAALSNINAAIIPAGLFLEAGPLTPVISGAGNVASGTLILLVGP